MNAYLPNDWRTIAALAALLAFEVFAGYALSRWLPRRTAGRLLAWLMTAAAGVAAERLTAAEPAGVRMVALILGLLYGMKAIVGVEAGTELPFWRWLGFCMLWFGMRPGLFARAAARPRRDVRPLFMKGLIRSALGLVLIGVAWAIQSSPHAPRAVPSARGACGLLWSPHWAETILLLFGLSLLLHFGVFNILAAFWRYAGVDARPLFRAPLLSTSLDEFWSRRWNIGFSEMTALAVYRPAAGRLGRRAALLAAFAYSGLVHELAVSVPVRAGYGGPSLYFLLHALLVQAEEWLARRGTPISARPWLGRAWTLAALGLPLPLLFHRPFLAGVVWPLIGIEGD